MDRTRRAGRRFGAVGMAAAALVLTACNPLSQEPFIPANPNGWSTAKVRYEGPADAWVEVGLTGIDGYQADTRTAVWVPQPDPRPVPEQRQCRSATERTVVVPCAMGYAEFPHSERRRADLDPAGTYWPAILVHPGEEAQVMVYCAQGGTPAACPATTTVELRTVDAAGTLIGDLHGIPLP